MMDEAAIRKVVTRLARPRASGERVIEHAAILAEGADSGMILAWIATHDGQPERVERPTRGRGLHQREAEPQAANAISPPRRYLLPPDALS